MSLNHRHVLPLESKSLLPVLWLPGEGRGDSHHIGGLIEAQRGYEALLRVHSNKEAAQGCFSISFLFSSAPALLRNNWQIKLCLSSIMWWFDICIHCERIIIIKLIIHLSPWKVNFGGGGKILIFKIYSLSKFQIYNTVLLTIVTILFIRSSELIHLVTENLYHWPTSSCFPYLLIPDNDFSTLWFYEFDFFLDFKYKWSHIGSVCLSFSDLVLLAQYPQDSPMLL